MPTLGNALDFAKLEARNIRHHQLAAAPSSPVTGQMYYNTGDNTLYWWDGTTWQSAKGGGGGAPSGPAGGDLSGTYPNPTIGVGKVTSSHILDGTITDTDVAAANKNGSPGVYSMRTLGFNSVVNGALPSNTDLAGIAGNNLNTNNVSLNNWKLTAVADPTAAQDAANKQYVDNLSQGLDAKASVKCATTANIANLASLGSSIIDGVALANGDRVLVKDQTTQSQNGIYIFGTPNDLSLRAPDVNTWAEVPSAYTWVEQGTTQADTGWVCTADQGGTLGTTAITWTKFSSAAAAQVAYYSNNATHGAGATITITQATHGLRASRGIHVQVQDNTTGAVELPDIAVAATGDVTITYGASVSANSKLVTLVG